MQFLSVRVETSFIVRKSGFTKIRKFYQATYSIVRYSRIKSLQKYFSYDFQKYQPAKQSFFPVPFLHQLSQRRFCFCMPISHKHFFIIIFYFIERRSKNMKFTSSLLTQSTKQTFLNSLHGELHRSRQPLTVFTKIEGKTYKLTLPLEDKTINELLLDAIEQFNTYHGLNFKTNSSTFLLYAAKKNGKICSDYPSFEPNQKVLLTKVCHFYLKEKPNKIEQPRILTHFSNTPKEEVKAKERSFCCLFSSRK